MERKNNTLVPVLLLYNLDSTWGLEEELECMRHVELMAEALRKKGHEVEGVPVRRNVAYSLVGYDPKKYIVFNWCEGIDGGPNDYDVVARQLDELGFVYTGAGPESLALTQNKGYVKRILDQQRISTPPGRVFTHSEDAGEWTVFPAIVKPVAEHGSYGINHDSIVDDVAGLQRQIDYIMKEFGVGALVEEFIAGREINVAIWGNGALETLPLYEILFTHTTDPRRQVVDYDTKWSYDSIQFKHSIVSCPADVDESTARHARSTALAAYKALGCRDYGRIDMRVRDGVSYVVDVNANPDITIEGGFANTVRAAGLDYGAMASRIVKLAAERRYHDN
jgi:D-alanine-D-alanine ligase